MPTPSANLIAYAWVALGGALGSVARFWMSGLVATKIGETFPWGTLVVNVTGSLVIGMFGAFATSDGHFCATPGARQFVMIGLCGGYTTFSSFSIQTLKLLQDREWLYAGGNVLLSVALCLVAVWIGYTLGLLLNSARGA